MQFKTTLVYPAISQKGFSSLLLGMDGGWISHGLASISASAKAKGFSVNLIDLRALQGWEHFRKVLHQRTPDVVAFTMMSCDAETVRNASALVKEVNPNIITVAGGPHVCMAPDNAASIPHIDYLVIGEGEEIFPWLLSKFASGELPTDRIQHSNKPDIDKLPFIDRQIFIDEWQRCGFSISSPEVPFLPELPAPFATIIAGRGCPFNCSFCKPGEDLIFGPTMRTRSPDNVIAELVDLSHRHQLASFLFHDDCLLHNRAWMQNFTDLYCKTDLNMHFFLQSRADLLISNQDLLPGLYTIGMRGVFIGFESGSQRILDLLCKGTSVADNYLAAKICKNHKLAIWANYMLGIPTETREDVLATVAMIRDIDPDYYSPAFFTPQPGTELGKYVTEHGLSLNSGYESMYRNPDKPKIRDIDYTFLQQAIKRSLQRKPYNKIRRQVCHFTNRAEHKIQKVMGRLIRNH